MPRHLIALAVAAFLAASAPVLAAGETPAALLDEIYGAYRGDRGGGNGIALDDPAVAGRYFVPEVAAALVAMYEKARQSEDVPALDGDPFVDAQDWDIADLDIDVKEGGDMTRAVVRFTSFEAPMKVTLDLVRSGGAWRIADIRWDRGGGLRETLGLK